ncbi:MAG: TatA/E family twin arginine-targeting protein translocase [Cyanobium sp.]|jgi:sec-independent protein translocase protein TatA
MNIFGIGLPEMAVIAAIGLLVFGPKRLPELGKTLGRTLRGFQSASQEFEKEFRTAITPEEGPEVVAAQALPAQESLAPASAVVTTNPAALSVSGESADGLSAEHPHG